MTDNKQIALAITGASGAPYAKRLLVEIVNAALNDTLSRTLMTSLTTLLVVMALFIFGGEVIHAFSIALLFGIVIGTYSSIYIASNTILVMGVSKEDLLPPVKEDDENVNPDGSQV